MQPQLSSAAAPLCPVLVGRDDLVALADRRLDAARAGRGHLLLFAGEAGIGKTRLLSEVRDRAGAVGVTVVTVAAYPRDSEIAGGLLADLAGTAAAGELSLCGRIATRLREETTRLPEETGAGDASRQRRLLVTDLAELFLRVGADHGPVLLALEDLHWADELTLEILDRVARRLPSVPMLVVGTYRSDELFPRVPLRAWRTRLLTQRLAEEARLARLGPDGTAAMAAAITGAVLPADVTAAVHERSDGIPLHVEEFLAFDASGRSVPDTLADAVLARAHDLSGLARKVVGAAAVIGRSFDLDLLTAITDEQPDEVDAALRELDHRFFVQPRRDGSAYDFRHALIRDALYADLPPHRRRELHARVAAAAVAAGFGDAFVSDQFERAAQPARAYRHALVAAEAAGAMSAHREAVGLYRRAQRTAPSDTSTVERADLLAALAGELAAIDDNAGAAAAYAEAHALRHALGDDAAAAGLVPPFVAVRHLLGAGIDEREAMLREALSRLDADPVPVQGSDTRARLLAGLSAAYMLDRCLNDSIEFGRQAHALAADVGDHATRLNTDSTLGAALVFAGRMDEGWQLLESAVSEARKAQLEAEAARGYRMIGSAASVLVEYDRALCWLRDGIAYADRTERFNDRHYMTAHLAHALWATGDWTAAEREARQALADGRGGVTTRITALYVLGYLALGRGDTSGADAHLREALELGERMAELQRLSPAMWGLAELTLHKGFPADAVGWCERGLSASDPAGDAAYLFPYVVTGTRAYLALDDLTGARDWVARSTRWLTYRGVPGCLPAVDHAEGLLHLAGGQTGLARESLERASAGWDSRRRFWEGTQAVLDRALAAQRSRRPGDAAALAADARQRAATAGATVLLARADAIRAHDAPGQVLTPREVEIARLVATGATNRQIAESLSISAKTVAAHVEHILAKLGAARRAEIAAWATANTRP